MPIFRRNREASLPPESWGFAQGENDGKPLILRYNAGVPKESDRARWPIRLGLAVPLKEPDERGFPGDRDVAALDQIEDALTVALAAKEGVLTNILTTSGMREFVTYVKTEDDAREVVDVAQRAGGEHEVQAYSEHDPAWDGYREFTP